MDDRPDQDPMVPSSRAIVVPGLLSQRRIWPKLHAKRRLLPSQQKAPVLALDQNGITSDPKEGIVGYGMFDQRRRRIGRRSGSSCCGRGGCVESSVESSRERRNGRDSAALAPGCWKREAETEGNECGSSRMCRAEASFHLAFKDERSIQLERDLGRKHGEVTRTSAGFARFEWFGSLRFQPAGYQGFGRRFIAEVYQELQMEGFLVDYERVPITDEKSPKERDFDDLVHRISQVENDTEYIFNCQMGRGRTTTGMVIATLVYLNRIGASGIPRTHSIGKIYNNGLDVSDNMPNSEDAARRGEYPVIRSLIRVLEGGLEGKRQVDKVIDKCDAMQNLREAIGNYRNNILRQPDEKKREASLSFFVEYLERYYFLICFAVYIHTERAVLHAISSERNTFSDWMRARPELYSILRRCVSFQIPASTTQLSILSRSRLLFSSEPPLADSPALAASSTPSLPLDFAPSTTAPSSRNGSYDILIGIKEQEFARCRGNFLLFTCFFGTSAAGRRRFFDSSWPIDFAPLDDSPSHPIGSHDILIGINNGSLSLLLLLQSCSASLLHRLSLPVGPEVSTF
ncbi:hypothetical protein MA16_Dca026235 [Dendrobium catenatum]|uniref:Paladin n=1 Tax=Dendrobium catenatum TaxID=906689 RepID=A0A2I0WJD9_9ASPA|nr:hypothetical protein MA16_Dca026235 [Dendrobium catenatum]